GSNFACFLGKPERRRCNGASAKALPDRAAHHRHYTGLSRRPLRVVLLARSEHCDAWDRLFVGSAGDHIHARSQALNGCLFDPLGSPPLPGHDEISIQKGGWAAMSIRTGFALAAGASFLIATAQAQAPAPQPTASAGPPPQYGVSLDPPTAKKAAAAAIAEASKIGSAPDAV